MRHGLLSSTARPVLEINVQSFGLLDDEWITDDSLRSLGDCEGGYLCECGACSRDREASVAMGCRDRPASWCGLDLARC